VRELLRRLHHLLNRRRFDADLREELELHRELAAQDGGLPLGDTLRIREDAREAWGWTWIEHLVQDVRFALRTMRSSPGFTLSAVLVLGVGIGATVAAFSAFNLAVLRPLPIPEPAQVLRFQRLGPDRYWTDIPYPATRFYREHARTLSAVFTCTTGRVDLEGDDAPAAAYFVSGNFLAELGARAALGRVFTTDDERPEAPPMVVLPHHGWTDRFGADPQIVGRVIHVNGRPATVVGVAARDFSGLGADTPALWALAAQQPYFVAGSVLFSDFSGQRYGGTTNMWGRLRHGVPARAAEEELAALAAELRKDHPRDVWESERLRSLPGGYLQSVGSKSRGGGPPPGLQSRVYPLFGIVGVLVLLILAVACGNLGSLLLARSGARRREIALRVAVGAGTGRLVRQLFTESLVLALLGAVTGLAIGSLVLKGVLLWTEAPPWFDTAPDGRVVAFGVAVGFVAAVLFGLAPALHVARLREGFTIGRTALIGAQVAASCVLLVVAGLLVRAFDRALSRGPGFEYRQTLLVDPMLSDHGYGSARAQVYLDDVAARLRATPGVASVALAATPPLGGGRVTSTIPAGGRALDVYIQRVDPSFLATLRIPLLRGRNVGQTDEGGVVVSESLARLRWPGQDPLGQTLQLEDEGLATVVGVAADARAHALGDPDAVELYRPLSAEGRAGLTIVVRTSGPPEAVAPAIAAAAAAADPEITPRVQRLETLYRNRLREMERGAVAVTVLGGIALLVACLGVVGLVGYAVAQRTKEIGVRMALGATRIDILRSLARHFVGTVAVGLGAGALLAAGVAQLLRRQLHGVSTVDPVSYAAALALFVAAAALAALLPARRALRVDPATALRCD
jgi:predicted permease